jgi:predicted dehydrogenase
MSDRLRVGIVGTGFMGSVHSRAARRAGAEIVAVATRSADAEAAERMGAARAVATLEDLLVDVDVVHLCTPNRLHEEQALAALAAGVHVVCEKPLSVDAASARRMADAAAAAGVVATVPFVYRFYGSVREMRTQLRNSGPLVQLRGSYLQDWLADSAATNWRVDPAAGGSSRAFGDIGVHWMDLAEFVTGQSIARLTAQVRTVVPCRGGAKVTTEDLAGVLFETTGGVTGQLAVSQVSWGRTNRLQLDVDAVRVAMSFCSEQEEQLWIGDSGGVRLLPRGRSGDPAVLRFDRVPAGHPQGYQDCFDAFVADTYAAVRGDDPDGLPTFADGARAAEITDAVLSSAKSGGWVDVGWREAAEDGRAPAEGTYPVAAARH